MIRTILFIGLGSFAGGVSRYLLSHFIQNATTTSFPLGTLIVNILGCFVIGILYGIFDKGGLMNSDLRLFLTMGFCGGFTTFSTFMAENVALLKGNNLFYLSMNLTASILIGFLMLFLGTLIIKLL